MQQQQKKWDNVDNAFRKTNNSNGQKEHNEWSKPIDEEKAIFNKWTFNGFGRAGFFMFFFCV